MTGVRTVTLTEFLLARIAEDEADARAAVDDDPNWLHLGDGRIIQGDAGFAVSSGWLELPHRHEAGDHIARHDPTRVLAECEAKRRIVGLHQTDTTPGVGGIPRPYCTECGSDEYPGTFPCPTLRLLALPYADHPDCPEWKP